MVYLLDPPAENVLHYTERLESTETEKGGS